MNIYKYLSFSIILLACSLFFSCSESSSDNKEGVDTIGAANAYKVEDTERTEDTPPGNQVVGALNFFIHTDTALKYISNFDTLIRNGNTSLSESVWLSSESIDLLYTYMKDSTRGVKVDGLRIYMAAYNKGEAPKAPGRDVTRRQSTILIVPTVSRNVSSGGNLSSHEDRWNILPNVLPALSSNAKGGPRGAGNHGELCPTKCND
jgi:hypothetical protein